ncbi:MAG: hypothetical protein KDD02_01110 [Phaeodactylibacter sp.]|nr:hypothetical protein [Phaeodactylibacter sp.]MCB9303257.1 hypothetical protein [Lewinellaceae bacterium]
MERKAPASKRKFGYFSLPLLWGDCFVGHIDAKANRKTGTFCLNKLGWESGKAKREEIEAAFAECLLSFIEFNQCQSLALAPPAVRQLNADTLKFFQNNISIKITPD